MKKFRAMVLISNNPESIEQGSKEVYQQFQEKIKTLGLEEEIAINFLEDIGLLRTLPLVVIFPEAVVYAPVSPENINQLVEQHLVKGNIVTQLQLPPDQVTGKLAWIHARKGTIPAEQRIALRRAGLIDPNNIEDYLKNEGYSALKKVIKELKPDQVVEIVKQSGLKGRGGAGFPTGLKWGFVAKEKSEKKYVICNADESEPGTFKDRLIMENDPHSIVEAMTIAAYAVGADEGYIYIRGEYVLSQKRMRLAITQAQEKGYLGKNIFGSDFCFDIHVHSGAGAYICGEETALIESIEGKRGQPRSRPPYPTTCGLWCKPTLVNNVETLSKIPPIVINGADWYRSIGTPNSHGTKIFTILGRVNKPGWVEAPMGITLRELINIYGNGVKGGGTLKLAQIGGSSGSVIPSSLQDIPLDFDSFNLAGVSLGSGAILIGDEHTCVVDLAKVILKFFRNESCGKCNPCRIGTQRTYELLNKISKGMAELRDLDTLEQICEQLYQMSNCGLGQTAIAPIRDILKYFRAEVEAHIRLHVCPTGVCEIVEPVLNQS